MGKGKNALAARILLPLMLMALSFSLVDYAQALVCTSGTVKNGVYCDPNSKMSWCGNNGNRCIIEPTNYVSGGLLAVGASFVAADCSSCLPSCKNNQVACKNQAPALTIDKDAACQNSQEGQVCDYTDAKDTNDGLSTTCGSCNSCNIGAGFRDCIAAGQGCITQAESDILKAKVCPLGQAPDDCGVCAAKAGNPVYLDYWVKPQIGNFDVTGEMRGGSVYADIITASSTINSGGNINAGGNVNVANDLNVGNSAQIGNSSDYWKMEVLPLVTLNGQTVSAPTLSGYVGGVLTGGAISEGIAVIGSSGDPTVSFFSKNVGIPGGLHVLTMSYNAQDEIVYFTGAKQVSFVSSAMGVGFAETPNETLEVRRGLYNDEARIRITGNNPELQLQYGNPVSNEHWGIYTDGNTSALKFWGLGENRFVIAKNGNVGIGVEDPQNRLDVKGGLTLNGTINSVINTLYNQDGELYWNGARVATGTIPVIPAQYWVKTGNDISYSDGKVIMGDAASNLQVGTETLSVMGQSFRAPILRGLVKTDNGTATGVGVANSIAIIADDAATGDPSLALVAKGSDKQLSISYNFANNTASVENSGRINFNSGPATFNDVINLNGGYKTDKGSQINFGMGGEYIYSIRDEKDSQKWGLNFVTGYQDQMVIRTNGDVGIGTTNPQAKLDVVGTIKISDSIINKGFSIGYASSSDTGYMIGASQYYFEKPIVSNGSVLGISSIVVDSSNKSLGKLKFGGDTSGEYIYSPRSGLNMYSLVLGTGGVDKMTILTNGNVGIGTSNPQSKLDVDGVVSSTAMKLQAQKGTNTTNGMPNNPATARTCDAAREGTIIYSRTPIGNVGNFFGCVKTATSTYSWRLF